MKNLTREKMRFKTIRCINKDNQDYVDIQIPQTVLNASYWWYFCLMAPAYAGWSELVGWNIPEKENDPKPEFHFVCIVYEEEPDKGGCYIPGAFHHYIVTIDLTTNKPTQKSLDELNITESQFYKEADVKKLTHYPLHYSEEHSKKFPVDYITK